MEKFPEDLEELFQNNPEVTGIDIKTDNIYSIQICDNNLDFTATPHTPLKRDGVLFITQRRQATSDLRENPKVRQKHKKQI